MGLLQRARKVGRKFLNPVETSVGGPWIILKILPLYLTNKEEREPKVALGPFVTDTSLYKIAPVSGLRVTWFGHSGMLVEIDDVRVLIDPVWDERVSPISFMGPKRFFAPTLRLEDMPKIDVVLISHNHYDHLGRKTIEALADLEATAEARWVTSLGVGSVLQAFGVAAERITELDWTEAVTVGGLQVTALPARHFSGRSLSDRFETLWSSFVLKGTKHTVYYGADSGWWEGFAEIGATYGPFDLTMIEIGAFNEMWGSLHLGPDGAVQAFEAIDAGGMLMPIHWGLFDLALHAWRQPIERVSALAGERGIALWAPKPGVPTEVVRGEQVRSEWWR